MARDTGYLQYVIEEVLSGIPGLSWKAMFSGFGLYKDGVIFALILGDQLYFKVGDENRGDFEKYDSQPFSYQKKNNNVMITSYYTVPEEIMENKQAIQEWVERSLAVSRNKKER